MIQSAVKSRQRLHVAWTREHLIQECSLALGQAINTSTWKNYGSALNSYLSFVCMHDFPIEPTPDPLSFFTVYMCHHINPLSVDTYLSGICQQLEPYFLPFERPRSLCYAKEPSLAASVSGVSPPNERELCPWMTCVTLSPTIPTHTLMMTSCSSLSSSLASLRSCIWVSW